MLKVRATALTCGLLLTPVLLGSAWGQDAGAPAAAENKSAELPPVEVTTSQQKQKTTAKKTAKRAPVPAPAPIQPPSGIVVNEPSEEELAARAADAAMREWQANGNPNPNKTLVELPPAYAGGQVATGGQIGLLGNRSVMDTPYSQTNYTNKTIQDQQARTVQDVLANDPSAITLSRNDGIDVEIYRGFRQAAFFGSRALNGLQGLAPLDSPSTDYIERVSVQRGPGSMLNGMSISAQGNIGGSVDLVTKQASDYPITELTTRYASDSQLGGHVDLSRRFGDAKQFGIRFNGAYDAGDTPIDTQDMRFGTAALNLDYRGDRVRVSADVAHQSRYLSPSSNQIDSYLFESPLLKPPSNRTNLVPSWDEVKLESTLGMVRAEVDLTDNLTAYGAIGKQRHTRAGNGVSYPELELDGSYILPLEIDDFEAEIFSTQGGLRATATTGPIGHELSFNASYHTYDSTQNYWGDYDNAIFVPSMYNPIFPARPTFPAPEDRVSDVTVFTQESSSYGVADTLSILDDRIQFTAGVRYQEISADSRISRSFEGSAWTPTYGLVVRPWQNVSLYGNYAEDLRPGTLVGADFANSGEILPAYIHEQQEAGIKVDWGRVTTTLAAFEIMQQNNIVVPGSGGALPSLLLNGEQINRGIELNAYGELATGVRILSGITLLDGRQEKTRGGALDGERAESSPAVRTVIGGEWDTPFIHGFTLSGRFTYTSEQSVSNYSPDATIPSWTQFDLGARYTFLSDWTGKPVTIRANVDNVFDDSFWKGSYSSGWVFRSDPRTYSLSTTFQF